jgi:hypothetical protein
MRTGLFLGFGAIVAGCGGAEIDGATGVSQARIVLSAQGKDAATLHVTAADETTADVVLDKTVTVDAGSASILNVTLDPAHYTFTASVLGSAGDVAIAEGSTNATLAGGQTTQVTFAAETDASGAAHVLAGADTVPQIDGVSVHVVDGSAGPTAEIKVDATCGQGMTYFWSGDGIQGSVQGSETIEIPEAAIKAIAHPVVHVVVQDAHGAAAAADIPLTVTASGVAGSVASGASAGANAEACLATQAQCNAACSSGIGLGGTTLNANASCLANCGASFASCVAQ